MRSFLSIFSRRNQYPDIDSIMAEVGFSHEMGENVSILGYSSDTAFLSSYSVSEPVKPFSCFIETETYVIQHDIRVINKGPHTKSLDDLFSGSTVERLFADPKGVNDLPIRDFHLIIWDKKKRKLLAFRDQIGVWPLFYYLDDNWLIISTDIVQIRSLSAVKPLISEEWVADLLVNLHSSASKTFYQNIHLIEPGQVLISNLKNIWIVPYYNLLETLRPGPRRWDMEEAVEIFRVKLENAIEKRVNGYSSVGSELSGGLDSSGIVSIAYPISQNNGTEFHTFSNVLPAKERTPADLKQDDAFYGSLLADELGIGFHHQFCGEGLGILSEIKSHLKTSGMPTQQLFTMFSDEIYRRVSELGIHQLLSGFGGDECVSFSGSGFFAEMAHEKKWEIFFSEMKTSYQLHNKPLLRAYTNYVVQRYIPFGNDLLSAIKEKRHWKYQKIKGFGYDARFGQKMQIKSRYLSNKGIQLDPNVRIRQYHRLIHPYVSRRLIGSYQAGMKYGFSYAFPLLDRDLLEFHLSLPSVYKYKNGNGRVLFRESLKGALPDNIRLRNDKQIATVPTVHLRLHRDKAAIRSLIKHSETSNKFHYVDYQKLAGWLEILVRREYQPGLYHNPNAFYNSLQILLLQEMERTGEFKTGIYC